MKGSLDNNLLGDIEAGTLFILVLHLVFLPGPPLPWRLSFGLHDFSLLCLADLVVPLMSVARTKSDLEYSLL